MRCFLDERRVHLLFSMQTRCEVKSLRRSSVSANMIVERLVDTLKDEGFLQRHMFEDLVEEFDGIDHFLGGAQLLAAVVWLWFWVFGVGRRRLHDAADVWLVVCCW